MRIIIIHLGVRGAPTMISCIPCMHRVLHLVHPFSTPEIGGLKGGKKIGDSYDPK